jgi:hypothetical protein
VALTWALETVFPRDLEQLLTLRDVESITRIGAALRSGGPAQQLESVEGTNAEVTERTVPTVLPAHAVSDRY